LATIVYQRCSGYCKRELPLTEEFFSRSSHNRTGRQTKCKTCDTVMRRANKWVTDYGASEIFLRRVLEDVQRSTCPLCVGPLHWTDVGMKLHRDRESGELLAFTHQGCLPSKHPLAWSAVLRNPPFAIAYGEPYIPRPLIQEALWP